MAGPSNTIEHVLKLLLDKPAAKAVEKEVERIFMNPMKKVQNAFKNIFHGAGVGGGSGSPGVSHSPNPNTGPGKRLGAAAVLEGRERQREQEAARRERLLRYGSQAHFVGSGIGNLLRAPFGVLGMGGIAGGAAGAAAQGYSLAGGGWRGAALGGIGGTLAAGAGILGFGVARAYSQEGAMASMQRWGSPVGLRGAGMRYGMGAEASAAMAHSLAQQTGWAGTGTLRNTAMLERGMGLGSASIGLLGAISSTRGTGMKDPREQMRMFGLIIGQATAKGLERGRLGEVFQGISQMMHGATLGTVANQASINALYGGIAGMGERYGGAKAFGVMQGLHGLALGNSPTSAGRAAALMAGGFGSGTSYVQALKNMEGGLTGEGGLEKAKALINQFSQRYGSGEEGHLALARATGLPVGVAGDMMTKGLGGQLTKEKLEEYRKQGMSKAETMAEKVNNEWGKITHAVHALDNWLADIGKVSADTISEVFKKLPGWMKVAEDTFNKIADWIAKGPYVMLKTALSTTVPPGPKGLFPNTSMFTATPNPLGGATPPPQVNITVAPGMDATIEGLIGKNAQSFWHSAVSGFPGSYPYNPNMYGTR